MKVDKLKLNQADDVKVLAVTDTDRKLLDYAMAKALLAAQVSKGLIAEETFRRMEARIQKNVESCIHK